MVDMTEREIAAIEAQPYDDDPNLAWRPAEVLAPADAAASE